jgi:Family of unknown function (DUF5677)
LNTNTVRPELVEGLLHQTIDSINLEFDREFEKLKNFVTQLKFNKKSKKDMVPILLACYLIENLVALLTLRDSQVVVPLYAVLRSIFEAAFKLCYLASDTPDSKRGREIEFAALQSGLMANKRWNKTSVALQENFETKELELTERIAALGEIGAKITFEKIIEACCQNPVRFASWYAAYSLFSGLAHADIDALSKRYMNSNLDVFLLNHDKTKDENIIFPTAIHLMQIAGSSLDRIFQVSVA